MRKTNKANQPDPTVQTSVPELRAKVVPALIKDEFAGQGGSFVFNPKTGKRTRRPAEK